VPWDVLSNGVEGSEAPLPVSYRTRARQPGDPAFVDRAGELLSASARPVIVAGSSIHWDDAAAPLAAFAERLGAPVYLNGAGRGCLPADHPHFFSQTRKEALGEADVVVIAGTPLDFRLGYGAGIAEMAKIVQIDGDGAEIGRNRAVDVGIVGDSRSVLEQLAAAIAKRRRGEAPASRSATLRHPGRWIVRTQRHGLRHRASIPPPDGGGRRQRCCVGADPAAASAALRPREEPGNAACAYALRQGGRGARRAWRAGHGAGPDPAGAGAGRPVGNGRVRQRGPRPGGARCERSSGLCHLKTLLQRLHWTAGTRSFW